MKGSINMRNLVLWFLGILGKLLLKRIFHHRQLIIVVIIED